jgi:hypothetical protein
MHTTTTATNHVPIIGATGGLCYRTDAGAGTLTYVLLLAMVFAAC